jgi:CPA1 family monovalent cation:H+ antiporter
VIIAAISHLDDARRKDRKESAPLYEDLTRQYHRRLASLQPSDGNRGEIADRDHFLHLFLEALGVERNTAIRLRDEGRINDEVMRRFERELDLTESRLLLAR